MVSGWVSEGGRDWVRSPLQLLHYLTAGGVWLGVWYWVTTGAYNVAIGYEAGAITTGTHNAAIGYSWQLSSVWTSQDIRGIKQFPAVAVWPILSVNRNLDADNLSGHLGRQDKEVLNRHADQHHKVKVAHPVFVFAVRSPARGECKDTFTFCAALEHPFPASLYLNPMAEVALGSHQIKAA